MTPERIDELIAHIALKVRVYEETPKAPAYQIYSDVLAALRELAQIKRLTQIHSCNNCAWRGPTSECVCLGRIGPLCPECLETTEEEPSE